MNDLLRFSHLIEKLINENSQPKSVILRIGELIPLTDNDITQQWSILTHQTQLEQTSFHIQRLQAELQCMACFEKYHPMNQITKCPICGSMGAKVITGEELRLESLYE